MGSNLQNVKFIDDNQLEFCSQKAVEESYAYFSHYSHNEPQPYETIISGGVSNLRYNVSATFCSIQDEKWPWKNQCQQTKLKLIWQGELIS